MCWYRACAAGRLGALASLCMRRCCIAWLGELVRRSCVGRQVGWKHQEAVKTLEEARKVKSSAYYQAKKKLNALRAKAVSQVDEA